MLMLLFWGRLIRMPQSRIVKQIYEVARDNFMTHNIVSWCKTVCDSLVRLGLQKFWNSQQVPAEKQWRSIVEKAISTRDHKKWRARILDAKKLSLYPYLVRRPQLQPYLSARGDTYGRRQIVNLRGGCCKLRVETERWLPAPHLPRSQRKCLVCGNGQAEDEMHFLALCPAYASERDQFYREIAHLTRGTIDLKSCSPRFVSLFVLGLVDYHDKEPIFLASQSFVGNIARLRNSLVGVSL
jgi:hypothetical protein